MKEQLKKALAQVEAKEQAVAESLKPQTVEQVDELERKMKDALQELQQRREELKRKADQAPPKGDQGPKKGDHGPKKG